VGTNGLHGPASPSSSEVLGAPPRLVNETLPSGGILHYSESAPDACRVLQSPGAQATDSGRGAQGRLHLHPTACKDVRLSTVAYPGTITCPVPENGQAAEQGVCHCMLGGRDSNNEALLNKLVISAVGDLSRIFLAQVVTKKHCNYWW
jgi:hypothetical protein